MGKNLLIGSIAVSGLSVIVGLVNYNKFSETKKTKEQTEQTLQQTQQTVAKVENDLKEVQEKLATSEAEKAQVLGQTKSAQAAADELRAKLSDLENQFLQKSEEVRRLENLLKEKEEEVLALGTAVAPSETAASAETAGRISELEGQIAKLQGELDASRARLREFETEKANRLAMKMREGLQGRILAVNPAWNFVVLNVGDRNGVVNNAEMLVERGGAMIGKVRITSVEPATSVADIDVSSVPAGVQIMPGDRVIFHSAGGVN